jgi:hypothetical protein
MRPATPQGSLGITVSLGCATAQPNHDLLGTSDQALYIANRNGGDQVHTMAPAAAAAEVPLATMASPPRAVACLVRPRQPEWFARRRFDPSSSPSASAAALPIPPMAKVSKKPNKNDLPWKWRRTRDLPILEI